MLISEIREETMSVEAVDRLLFEGLEDAGERADCVLVLGSLKAVEYRLPVAIEAYKAGRAEKLVLCGGKLRDFADGACSEAEHMRTAALAAGVPDADILLENTSQNTVENILCAMVELQRALGLNRVRSVLLVTTAYHMRRSLAIARHLFPSHIAVFPCRRMTTTPGARTGQVLRRACSAPGARCGSSLPMPPKGSSRMLTFRLSEGGNQITKERHDRSRAAPLFRRAFHSPPQNFPLTGMKAYPCA